MSGADILVSIVLLAAVTAIIGGLIRKQKKGGGCSCGCSGCGGSCPGSSSKKP